jgi:hypothetical protein
MDWDSVMDSLADQVDFKKFGKAAVLLGEGLTHKTPLWASLNKVIIAPWSLDLVHIVRKDGETKFYIQEKAGDLERFRGVKNADFRFVGMTGEETHKFTIIFYNKNGSIINATQHEPLLKGVARIMPMYKDGLEIFEGWSEKFVSVNVSSPNQEDIYKTMSKYRKLEKRGGGIINIDNMVGYVERQTYWTNKEGLKCYVIGKIRKEDQFRSNLEDKLYKAFNMEELMVLAPKTSMVQRVPTLSYVAWTSEAGYKKLQELENKNKYWYSDNKGPSYLTVRLHEKRVKSYEEKQNDRAGFGRKYRFGQGNRN